jgi:hypothetical protein
METEERSELVRRDRRESKFLPDKELSHRGTSEQWRVKVQVEMRKLFVFLVTIRWGLMDTHGVRERASEEIVVATGDPAQDVGKIVLLSVIHVGQGRQMGLG